jgi:mono/diheme cytochrome c family protein
MIRWWLSILLVAAGFVIRCAADEPAAPQAGKPPSAVAFQSFVRGHCLDCHGKESRKGGLALDDLLGQNFAAHSEAWEHVVRKLTNRQMPPPEAVQPAEHEYESAVAWLQSSLDAAAATAPNPGRTETFRRLNRTEYRNAIRDLLALDVEVAALLPADESSHGFDNVTVADLSPTLLNRYLSAAQKISRLAIGIAPPVPRADTIRVRPDLTQDVHIEGLPLGTRGGALIAHNFPVDGEYEIQIYLMRDRNEDVEGLRDSHQLEVLLNRERVGTLTVKPPGKGETQRSVDANLKVRIPLKAGPHKLGVTFVQKSSSLLETTRQPLNVHFNYYRHPRLGPAVYEVSVSGPYESAGPGDTPSRRRILTERPSGPDDEEACAKRILTNLVRAAYRRPITDEDLKTPLAFYRQGRGEGNFDAGIEAALCAVLVNPQFLFRIERDPADVPRGTAYRISDVALASRLSFFLWSSSPDEELLTLAERKELSRPEVLEKQVRRMLADERSQSLVTNFASQWLYLRNLDAVTPDMRLYPDFDDNLRQALRQETELLFASALREDQSVLNLLQTEHTWLNERLAKHYSIPHVYGDRFRRVELDAESHRGGLLRQGSILTVTSYASRTSPVIRGHWVLQNLLGAAPPPPPPDVPALEENTVNSLLSIRERLKQHRANAACASCHQQMDPVGFSLENFDAVGRWRKTDSGPAIDATGSYLDGSQFNGVAGLEKALLRRPELFARTLTEKLVTFGLGRGVESYDAPAVRQIVAGAKKDNYRFSQLIIGIVKSTPFQMRKTQ